MATFSSRITDQDYVSWLKVGLALNFLREGLKGFVETEGRGFQSSILKAIPGNHSPCQDCTRDDYSRRKREDVWKLSSKCPNKICDAFLAEIMKNYVQDKNISKPCTEPRDWPVDYFAVIQSYFGPGCGNKKSLEDCDCPNFLNLFINCKWFCYNNTTRDLGMRALNVLKYRNELMHSTSLKLSKETMKQWLSDMVALLQSLLDFTDRPEAVKARNDINDLCVSNLQITSTDEIQVLQQHMVDLQQKIKDSEHRVEDLSGMCQELSEDLQKMHKVDIQPLSTEVKDIADQYQSNHKEIQKLKTALMKTRSLLDQNYDLQIRMESKFQDVKADYATLSARLQEAEFKISRCKAIENKLKHLEERMDETEFITGETDSAVEQLGERVATYKTKFARMDFRVTKLEEKGAGEIEPAFRQLGGKIDNTNSNVEQLGNRLSTSETKFARIDMRVTTLEERGTSETEPAFRQLGGRIDNTNSTVEQLENRLATSETKFARIDTRVTTLEEEKRTGSCQHHVNPRLSRLREDTQVFLSSRITNGFIQTRQFLSAKKILEDTGCVLISGKPGEGKTTSAVVMMTDMYPPDRCVMLSKAADWDCVDTSQVDVVFIDDIVGLYQLDSGKLREWCSILDKVQACVNKKRVMVVMCTRANIISECYSKLQRFEMFKNRVYFSSDNLSLDEKKQILISKLAESNKTLAENDLTDCLSEFTSPIGFPYCCHLFTTDLILFGQKSKFFKKPFQFFIENVKAMDKTQMLAFLCVFYKDGKLEKSTFTVDQHRGHLKTLVSKIADMIGSEKEPKLGTVQDILQHHCGVYIENPQNFYTFAHNVMYETLGLIYGEKCPADVIQYCTLDFLCECIVVDKGKKTEGVLCVEPEQHEVLARRIIHEVVENKCLSQIACHPAFHHCGFVKVLLGILRESGTTAQFLLQTEHTFSGKKMCWCKILDNLVTTLEIFLEELHAISAVGSWCLKYGVRCSAGILRKLTKEVQESTITEGFSEEIYKAYYEGWWLNDNTMINILKTLSPVNPLFLRFMFELNDEYDDDDYDAEMKFKFWEHYPCDDDVFCHIVNELKRNEYVDGDNVDIQYAAKEASAKLKTSSLQLLLDAIYPIQSWCLKYAVKCEDDFLHKIVNKLKQYGASEDDESLHIAYCEAWRIDNSAKVDMLRVLSPVKPACLEHILNHNICHEDELYDDSVFCNAVDELKKYGSLDPDDPDIRYVANEASTQLTNTSLKLLLESLSSVRPWCLKHAVQCDNEILDKTIKELQDSALVQADNEEIQEAYCKAFFKNDSATLNMLKTLSQVKPACLKYFFQDEDSDEEDMDFSDDEDDVISEISIQEDFSGDEDDVDDYDDDVFCRIVSELKDHNCMNGDNKDIQYATRQASIKLKTSSLQLLLGAITPVRSWCLEYAVQFCDDEVLEKLVKDLQKSGPFEEDNDDIQRAYFAACRLKDSAKLNMLRILSPIKPSCLKRVVKVFKLKNIFHSWTYFRCNIDVLFEIVIELKKQESLNVDNEDIQDVVSKLITSSLRAPILEMISPVRPLCLKYAASCNDKAFCNVVNKLLKHGSLDGDDEDIQYAAKEASVNLGPSSLQLLLSAICPVRPWCLKYAVKCGDEMLNKIIKALQESGSVEAGNEEIQRAYYAACHIHTSVKLNTLRTLSAVRPVCLTYVFEQYPYQDDVFCNIVNELKKSEGLNGDDDNIQYAAKKASEELRTSSLQLLLDSLCPVRPWCLKYAVKCDVACLQKLADQIGHIDFGTVMIAVDEAVSSCDKIQILLRLVSEDKCGLLHDTLHKCLFKGFIDTVSIMKVRIHLKMCCLLDAVRSSNTCMLSFTIKELVKLNQWCVDNEHAHQVLELSLESGCVENVKQLLEAGVSIRSCCLRSACLSGNEGVVEMVVSDLKSTGQWNVNHKDIHRALRASIGKQKLNIGKLILSAASHPKSCCLKHAVNTNNKEFLLEFINKVKSVEGSWSGSVNSDVHSSVHESIQKGYLCMASLLLDNGASLADCCLSAAVQSDNERVLEYVLYRLQKTDEFDSNHEELHETVVIALNNDNYEFSERILRAIAHPQPCCLQLAVDLGSCQLVELILGKLKDSDNLDGNNRYVHTALEKTLICFEFKEICRRSLKSIMTGKRETSLRDRGLMTKLFLKAGARFRICCVKAATCNNSVSTVKCVVDKLKTTGVWDADKKDVHDALHLCLCKGCLDLVEFFNQEGVEIRPCCLTDAVISGKENVVDKVLKKLSDDSIALQDYEEVHEALEVSLEFAHITTMDKLIKVYVRPRPCCMKPAVKSGKEELVVKIILLLKQDGLWNADHKEIHTVLKLCIDMCQLKLLEIIIMELLPPSMCCFRHCIRTRNESLIRNMVEEFKESGDWSRHSRDVHEALEVSLNENNRDIAKLLLSEGASVRDCCLWHAVYSKDLSTLKFVIQKLKDTSQWNTCHKKIHDALKLSLEDGYLSFIKCILEALSPVKACCLQLTKPH